MLTSAIPEGESLGKWRRQESNKMKNSTSYMRLFADMDNFSTSNPFQEANFVGLYASAHLWIEMWLQLLQ